MFLTILSYIAFIVTIVLTVVALFNNKKTLVPAIVCFVIGLGLCSLYTVPTGHTGLVVTFGKVSETPVSNGIHCKIPFVQKSVVINNQVQRADVQGEAASKDLQTVYSNISVNFNILSDKSVDLYKRVGTSYVDVIIRPAVQEGVKATLAQFTAEELITRRAEVSEIMKEIINEKVSTYGIHIAELNIIDMTFSEEFNNAIEAKGVMEQQVLTEKQNLEKQKVSAEAKRVEAQAEADANTIRSNSITNNILLSDFIKKWDGKMPVVTSEGNMIDISTLIPDAK